MVTVIPLTSSLAVNSKDYIIFSVVQPVPMGEPGENSSKNYYINMGKEQGVYTGAKLDVYRALVRANPYKNNDQHFYKIKIGELKVLHSESHSAIGKMTNMYTGENDPMTEIQRFMIGDGVKVHVK